MLIVNIQKNYLAQKQQPAGVKFANISDSCREKKNNKNFLLAVQKPNIYKQK